MLANAITAVSDFLWGWPLIIILFGTHIFMTIRTGFIQKDVFKAIKLSVTPDKGATGNVSQFGALTTALSSTIGTGNIVGVGTAIALGGPGAVLWMWITGLLGMATCVLRHPAIDATSGNGANLTAQSFGSIPYIGTPILILGLISFAFSTILGWYYYGERCLVYLFGEQVIFLYKILWIIGVIVGSLMELNLVWSASELLNGLMAIPNIVAVLLLSAEIAKDTKRYKGKHIDDVDDTEIPVVRNAKRGVLHIPMEDPNHTDW